MALDRIMLAGFRNHRETLLEGTGQLNLLVGANGAGKTNVLEALSLMAPGRGLRRAALPDLAEMGGHGGFAISARLAQPQGGSAVQLGTGIEPHQPGRRLVQINGAPASAASLAQWLAISWLTPAMDGLFTAPAGERRRYMDRLALALFPDHARIAARFETALRERNRLLADPAGAPDPAWHGAIEAQLAQAGAALAAQRAGLIDALAQALAEAPGTPFPKPSLRYAPGGPLAASALAEALAAGRRRDQAAGRTLIGPQRDDLEVSMAGTGTPAARCSTGEQKALLLSLTLAHAGLAARGRPGVLLLDEVAAHLDPDRRAALFEQLRACGAQVWLTGTEPAPFAAILSEAALWEVSAGAARRA